MLQDVKLMNQLFEKKINRLTIRLKQRIIVAFKFYSTECHCRWTYGIMDL